MAFHYRNIQYTLLIFILAACNKIDEPEPFVRTHKAISQVYTWGPNILSSDFINWDSITFTFSHFEPADNWANSHLIFYSNKQPKDTLKLIFNRMPYNNITEYYCGNVRSEAYLNKFNGNKIKSMGEGILSYKKINEDSAEIKFILTQKTNYRLPDNTLLKADIKGIMTIPHVKI